MLEKSIMFIIWVFCRWQIKEGLQAFLSYKTNSFVVKMLEMDHETLEKFRSRVLDTLGGRVYSIIVYGSVARGTATKDSDIDILVIGKNKGDWETVSKIAYEIDFENGFRSFITTVFLTGDEFEHRLKAGDPFLYNVLKE